MSPEQAESARLIDAAVAALRAGELVVYPTETFYGIAADPGSSTAIARIFALKGRSPGQPIALIAADAASAFAQAGRVPPLARRLGGAFWPGPLTLVLPPRAGLPEAVLGPDGIGVRVSSHPVAQRLAAAFGRPITATSANASGRPAPAEFGAVRRWVGDRVKVLLDDGTLAGGMPSTVLAVSNDGYRIIRRGAIGEREIAAVAAQREKK
jgi:L-threonylcarbamoyladenylate synthase